MLPIRDGLRLTPRGRCSSASRSAIEWIGSSHVTRSQCGVEHRLGLGRQRRVLDPRVREALDDAPVERGVAPWSTVVPE